MEVLKKSVYCVRIRTLIFTVIVEVFVQRIAESSISCQLRAVSRANGNRHAEPMMTQSIRTTARREQAVLSTDRISTGIWQAT